MTLGQLRYRTVTAARGGPIWRLATGEFRIFGRRIHQANAWLAPGLVPARTVDLYSDAAGTGADRIAAVAQRMAISEALERWAYHEALHSPARGHLGFDIDCSSNGMAAYPSFWSGPARRRARLEAIERFCLLAWWEGRLEGERRATPWPGVEAIAIAGPFGAGAAILYRRSDWGYYCYGHAAAESFGAAATRALIELGRHDALLRGRCLLHGGVADGPRVEDVFERRSVFFSGDAGHALFMERVRRRATKPAASVDIIADAEVAGPWSRYARVWRFALRPPSARFLVDDERYFFW